MNIVKYEFVKRYNGNIRVFFGNKNLSNNKKLKENLKKEKKLIRKISSFQKKINKWKLVKKDYFKKLSKKYGPIPAKAFPGRASILINLLNLNSKNISNIYEKDVSLKVNKYAPGTNIKIVKEKLFNKKERNKKKIINLAWHISREIRSYLKEKMNYHGQVIDVISSKDFT